MREHPFLDQNRPIPEKSAANRVVQWHVFRERKAASDFANGIVLGKQQQIVGGTDVDSVGTLYWVGVEVEDISIWGNPAAVNKRAGV